MKLINYEICDKIDHRLNKFKLPIETIECSSIEEDIRIQVIEEVVSVVGFKLFNEIFYSK